MEKKRPLLVLTGPTAVGKTELSIALAKEIGGEIISADSMQVYRHMDIGSAKITPEEMQGVSHYLVDCLEPSEEFNIYVFQQLAKEAMKQIYSHGHIPVIVGGTGFYIQSLLYDIRFEEETHDETRMKYEELYRQKGAEYLHSLLREVDSSSATTIHANNVKRVIRALEFYELNHYPISEHNEEQRQKDSPYDFRYFVLTDERQKLYDRIEQRIEKMLEMGLIDEVRRLKEMGCHRNMVSMQGLGYKEILDYLDGEITLAEAVYRIKRDTRHFAKRQLTWFRREKDVIWVDKQETGSTTQELLAYMRPFYMALC